MAARKRAAGQPFFVGARGELRPDGLDGRQAQIGEHDPEARGVDRSGRGRCGLSGHAASPSRLS